MEVTFSPGASLTQPWYSNETLIQGTITEQEKTFSMHEGMMINFARQTLRSRLKTDRYVCPQMSDDNYANKLWNNHSIPERISISRNTLNSWILLFLKSMNKRACFFLKKGYILSWNSWTKNGKIDNNVLHLNIWEVLISLFSSDVQLYEFTNLEKSLLFLLLELLVIRITDMFRNMPGWLHLNKHHSNNSYFRKC